MKERKIDYTAPVMEVVELKLQGSLLAGSYEYSGTADEYSTEDDL